MTPEKVEQLRTRMVRRHLSNNESVLHQPDNILKDVFTRDSIPLDPESVLLVPDVTPIATPTSTQTPSRTQTPIASASRTMLFPSPTPTQTPIPSPEAISDYITLDANTQVTFDVLANDLGDSIRIISNSNANHGTVAITNQQITYTPNQDYFGQDLFNYTILDSKGRTSLGSVFLTINPPLPRAIDDLNITCEYEKFVWISVMSNDQVAIGQTITIDSFDISCSGGSIQQSGNRLKFTAYPNFIGTTSFSYTIKDNFGQTDSATVSIQVLPSSPIAVDDSYTVLYNTPKLLTLLDNDLHITGQTITIQSTSNPSHGTLSTVGGQLVYTPQAGYSGQDTFTYTIVDQYYQTDSAVVTLEVWPDIPSVTDASLVTQYNTPLNVLLSSYTNCNNIDHFTIFTSTTNGTVTLNVSTTGSSTFTPTLIANGYTTTFKFTVTDSKGQTSNQGTITILVWPKPPVVENFTTTVYYNTNATIAFTPHILHGVGVTSATLITGGSYLQHGTIIGSGLTLTYAPNNNYSGMDSVQYYVKDSYGQSSNLAIATMDIWPVIPSAISDKALLKIETGTSISIPVIAGSSIPGSGIPPSANADLGTGLYIHSVTAPFNGYGTTSISTDKQSIIYTVPSNHNNKDYKEVSFSYTVWDALTPSDPSRASIANVYVEIWPLPPVATNDTMTVINGITSSYIGQVLTAGTPDSGYQIKVTSVTSATKGTTSVDSNTTVKYIPNVGVNGTTDSFTYTIRDALYSKYGVDNTRQVTATVTVNILPPAPEALDETVTLQSNSTPVTLDILANENAAGKIPDLASTLEITWPSDMSSYATYTVSGSNITLTRVNSTITRNSDGINIIKSIPYKIKDSSGRYSNIAYLQLIIWPDPPIAANITLNPACGNTASFIANVISLSNKFGTGNTLVIDSFTQPSSGSVVKPNDTTLEYRI